MNISWRKLVLVFALLFTAVGTPEADEVHLKNGDHITGEVVTTEEDKLVLNVS